jgi:hypothetical protein
MSLCPAPVGISSTVQMSSNSGQAHPVVGAGEGALSEHAARFGDARSASQVGSSSAGCLDPPPDCQRRGRSADQHKRAREPAFRTPQSREVHAWPHHSPAGVHPAPRHLVWPGSQGPVLKRSHSSSVH